MSDTRSDDSDKIVYQKRTPSQCPISQQNICAEINFMTQNFLCFFGALIKVLSQVYISDGGL